MKTDRGTARVVGGLFIVGTVAAWLGLAGYVVARTIEALALWLIVRGFRAPVVVATERRVSEAAS